MTELKLSKADKLEIAGYVSREIGSVLGVKQEMSYKEATEKLFHGRPKRWVTRYILSKYPETWNGPDSWITKPQGKGHPIKVIDAVGAAIWLTEHADEIDWTSPYPETVSRKFKQTA